MMSNTTSCSMTPDTFPDPAPIAYSATSSPPWVSSYVFVPSIWLYGIYTIVW
jgi:hypothetical protein